MHGGHLTRTRLGIALAVVMGAVLGAVFGQPGSGLASSTAAKPTPKTPPTISGVAQVGETLVANRGTWNNTPTSFHVTWSRCDPTGAACLAIGGATAKIYTVTAADQGHTLRTSVSAHNASGTTTATSAQTLLVPASGCPVGVGTLPVAQVLPPRRLEITSASVSPSVNRSTHTLNLHVTITACGGRPVQGATVYGAAIPFNQFEPTQLTTGKDGTVTLVEGRRDGFPASSYQGLLAVFIRVTKPGEDTVFTGVSASRVVAFRFHS
jgi:hypothetical protein